MCGLLKQDPVIVAKKHAEIEACLQHLTREQIEQNVSEGKKMKRIVASVLALFVALSLFTAINVSAADCAATTTACPSTTSAQCTSTVTSTCCCCPCPVTPVTPVTCCPTTACPAVVSCVVTCCCPPAPVHCFEPYQTAWK